MASPSATPGAPQRVLLLSEDDVRRLATMELALEAVEQGLRKMALDEAQLIPRARAVTDHATLHVMGATAKSLGVMGSKVYSSGRRGQAQFVCLLFDGKTSALLAILFAEPDRERYATALDTAAGPRLSAVNFVEAAVCVDMGGNPIASDAFDDLIKEAGIVVEPVTAEQAYLARRAYRAYGRGSGCPARLNLGDCFAYALAKARGEPLLFKGEDFPHTDIEPALSD